MNLTSIAFAVLTMANANMKIEAALSSSSSNSSLPSIGVEARVSTNLPGTLLKPKPVDPKAPLLLRIADTRPHGTLIAYDLRYIGLEPGGYDLRDYLVRTDGSAISDLPSLPVEIVSVLPKRHDGLLIQSPSGPSWRLGGYRVALVMVGTLWLLLLVPLFLYRRTQKMVPQIVPPPEPTLADRLRPLIERAAAGQLDSDGKARLERLVLAHWRERLGLNEAALTDSLARLRDDPEGGAILRALERWLHQRPGPEPVDLEPLLAPYRMTVTSSE